MRILPTLIAAAAIAAFGLTGTAMAGHKGFSHGGPGSGNNKGGIINSVDVTIACTFDISDGTLTIVSDVADVTGDFGTFTGTVNVLVQAFDKGDGDANFALAGSMLRVNQALPYNESDVFGGVTFGVDEDLTGVVTVTGSTDTPGSLAGRTFFATCDTEDITVQA